MEVLLVRSVEKVLDAVNGRLKATAWSALLSKDDGLRVLQVLSQSKVHQCWHLRFPAHDGLVYHYHPRCVSRCCDDNVGGVALTLTIQ